MLRPVGMQMAVPDVGCAMEAVRWVLPALLGGFGLLVTVANWCILVVNARNERRPEAGSRFISFIPLIGGLGGALAVVAAPVSGILGYSWVPLVADYTVPATAIALGTLWRGGLRE